MAVTNNGTCTKTLLLFALLTVCSFILNVTNGFEILSSQAGSVEESSTARYELHQRLGEFIVVVLLSDVGDADVYLASGRQVSLDGNDYDYSSSSCGSDVVVIVNDEGAYRKLDLVVYGHPRYPRTKYRLYVIRSEKADLDRYSIHETWPNEDGTVETITRYEFADPMAIGNDPNLINIVDQLKALGYYYHSSGSYDDQPNNETSWLYTGLSFVGKIILFALEVLA